MGSKRSMLRSGLGASIIEQAVDARRVVDLFCGSSSIAWFVAENTYLPVLAVDAQLYATTLADSVIGRTIPIAVEYLLETWLDNIDDVRRTSPFWINSSEFASEVSMQASVQEARELCKKYSPTGPVWNAYGGYYFSPLQALTFDYLLAQLPASEPERSICLAATIYAASRCAAAPGHTAQPFQPTKTATVFLAKAWQQDPLLACRKALEEICPRHAKTPGKSIQADVFNTVIASWRWRDWRRVGRRGL